MPTVANLLSKPLFKNFRIISGKNGLNNNVTSAGFFEWEQDFQITKSFSKGEFVISTLSSFKDDSNAVEKSLKLLINNNVAAIAIKDIYYKDISDELKSYSNEHSIPIMFFSDTYIDELLYAVKNETLNSLYTSFNEIVLDTLIFNDNLDNLNKESLLRKLNPFFLSGSMMCAYISNCKDKSSISEEAMKLYNNALLDNAPDIPEKSGTAEFVYSFIAYKRGIFLIITSNSSDDELLQRFLEDLVKILKADNALKDTCIGISDYIIGIDDISTILLDAIFANTSCILDKKNVVQIGDAPFDHIVFKDRYLLEPSLYYERILDRLSETTTQRSPLLETLITLIECSGNVDMTAQKMYQHKNTIRYRLNKLKTVFDAENDMEFYGKLFFFSRLHFSKPYLDVFFHNK